MGPAPPHRRAPARGAVAAPKIPNHEAICARGPDDTEPRTPPRSSRQSWATSRCRCPDRRPPDHYRECPPSVAVASLSVPMADPSDTLPTDHRFHWFDNAEATQTVLLANSDLADIVGIAHLPSIPAERRVIGIARLHTVCFSNPGGLAA